MINLGALLRDGADGVPRDIDRSKQLFAQADRNGVASAVIDPAELIIAGEGGAHAGVHGDDWRLLEHTLAAVRVEARSALDEIVDEGIGSVWARRRVATLLFPFIRFSNFRITVIARIIAWLRPTIPQRQTEGILRSMLYIR